MAKEVMIIRRHLEKGKRYPGGDIPLILSYTDKDSKNQQQSFLAATETIHTGAVVDPVTKNSKEPLRLRIPVQGLKIEYEAGDSSDKEFVKATLLRKHPQMFNINAKKQHQNFLSRIFDYEILGEGVKSKFESISVIQKAIMLFFAMDPKNWRAAAIAAGVDPVRKTAQQIAVEMTDPATGAIARAQDVADKFVIWHQFYKENDVRSIVEKAILLNVITKEDGLYKRQMTTLGRNVDEVILYVTNHPEIGTALNSDNNDADTTMPEYEASIELMKQSVDFAHLFAAPKEAVVDEEKEAMRLRIEQLEAAAKQTSATAVTTPSATERAKQGTKV